jgi:hypothetical protein
MGSGKKRRAASMFIIVMLEGKNGEVVDTGCEARRASGTRQISASELAGSPVEGDNGEDDMDCGIIGEEHREDDGVVGLDRSEDEGDVAEESESKVNIPTDDPEDRDDEVVFVLVIDTFR